MKINEKYRVLGKTGSILDISSLTIILNFVLTCTHAAVKC